MKRWVSFHVSGNEVGVLDVEVPDDGAEPVRIVAQTKWKLQQGDRAQAYGVMAKRCTNYVTEHKVDLVVVKGSATGRVQGSVAALLPSAELRGAVIAGSAMAARVEIISKSQVSRTYGQRKVDEYLKDDDFWDDKIDEGNLAKWAREPLMYLSAYRSKNG